MIDFGDSRWRTNRGGSFAVEHLHLIADYRGEIAPNTPQPDRGLRPSRRLER